MDKCERIYETVVVGRGPVRVTTELALAALLKQIEALLGQALRRTKAVESGLRVAGEIPTCERGRLFSTQSGRRQKTSKKTAAANVHFTWVGWTEHRKVVAALRSWYVGTEHVSRSEGVSEAANTSI